MSALVLAGRHVANAVAYVLKVVVDLLNVQSRDLFCLRLRGSNVTHGVLLEVEASPAKHAG
jgi:hypothetical protein